MNEEIYIRKLHITFDDCSTKEDASTYLRALRLSINDWYPGFVQLFPSEDSLREIKTGYGASASLGIRLSEYVPNNYSSNPAQYGGELPSPWVIATDVISNINLLIDDVSLFSRSSYVQATEPADFDPSSYSHDKSYVNEYSAVWICVNSDSFSATPDWAEGRASAVYHIGSKTYDTREFGGIDPDISIEETAENIVRRALSEILPSDLLNGGNIQTSGIVLRFPRSLFSDLDNYLAWERYIQKKYSIGVMREGGLGFLDHHEVYGYYEAL